MVVVDRKFLTIPYGEEVIHGMLHLPVADTKHPAVLLCHGYRGDRMGRYRLYVELADLLAAQGIAAVRFDFLGCGESTGSMHTETVNSQVEQVRFMLDFLAKNPSLDANRMGLVGNSLGGAVAALAAAQTPSLKALALSAAIADGQLWLDEWQHKHPEEEISSIFPHGHEAQDIFASMRPAEQLHGLTHLPLLCFHGDCDDVVSLEHFHCYARNRKGVEADRFVEVPGVAHLFGEEPARGIYLKEISQWMHQHL